MCFADRPLIAIALGGHALCDPSDLSLASERQRTARLSETFDELIRRGYRLLLVHGNGPQVGRLLSNNAAIDDLDIHVAQTQGELGYLLCESISEPAVALVTTVEVSMDADAPSKPIGPYMASAPDSGAWVRSAGGWRRTVGSPVPEQVKEADTIESVSKICHVVAGGGGGVPITSIGEPVAGVVDKDYTAALLAIQLQAHALVFATNVDFIYEDFGEGANEPLEVVTTQQSHNLLREQDWPEGTMVPKLSSAVRFAEAANKRAHVCSWERIVAALDGNSGTTVVP